MILSPSLTTSGIWVILNTIDKFVYVHYSSNVLFGLTNMLRKLHYKERTLPPQLITDYNDGKLSFEYIESCGNNTILGNISKQYWMKKYTDQGYSLYNNKICKWFIHLNPIKHLSLDNGSERYLVHVMLQKKQGVTYNPLTVGVFNTIREAKEWCKWAYGDYDKYAVDRVVFCNSILTKTTLQNPLLMDKEMIELYRKVYVTEN